MYDTEFPLPQAIVPIADSETIHEAAADIYETVIEPAVAYSDARSKFIMDYAAVDPSEYRE